MEGRGANRHQDGDRPPRGAPTRRAPKLAEQAERFYAASRRAQLEITLECIDRVRREHPAGIPNADIRSPGEPLFGAPAVQ